MASPPIPAVAERCIRRSRVRFKVLMMLASLGEAYLGQLARAVGVEPKRVRAVMFGAGEDYRAELSLVALGLASVRDEPNGRVYRITPRGLRKARSLAKRARAGRDRLEYRADAVA